MRQTIVITFIALYLVALCRPVAPLLEYYANRDFFAEVLCINKAKPELECNGKCILMQKLRKAMKDESEPVSLPSVRFDDYPVGFIKILYTQTQPASAAGLILNAVERSLHDRIVTHQFFRPPRG